MLRVLGAAAGLTIMILGIVNLATQSFNVKLLVNSIYLVIFGLLIGTCCSYCLRLRFKPLVLLMHAVIAEMRLKFLLHWFRFLTTYIGIG